MTRTVPVSTQNRSTNLDVVASSAGASALSLHIFQIAHSNQQFRSAGRCSDVARRTDYPLVGKTLDCIDRRMFIGINRESSAHELHAASFHSLYTYRQNRRPLLRVSSATALPNFTLTKGQPLQCRPFDHAPLGTITTNRWPSPPGIWRHTLNLHFP
jgi:hypothetical protein